MKAVISVDVANDKDFIRLTNPTKKTILVGGISRFWGWCSPTSQPEMIIPQYKPIFLVLSPHGVALVTNLRPDFNNPKVTPEDWLYCHIALGFKYDDTEEIREMGCLFVERPDRPTYGLHLAFPDGEAAKLNFLKDQT